MLRASFCCLIPQGPEWAGTLHLAHGSLTALGYQPTLSKGASDSVVWYLAHSLQACQHQHTPWNTLPQIKGMNTGCLLLLGSIQEDLSRQPSKLMTYLFQPYIYFLISFKITETISCQVFYVQVVVECLSTTFQLSALHFSTVNYVRLCLLK